MHRSGPSRKKDENIFSDVYIPLSCLVHSTAYVQAHILNFLPVIRDATIPFFQIRSDPIQKILSIGRFRSDPILAQFFFFFINQCRVSILLCHFCVLNTS